MTRVWCGSQCSLALTRGGAVYSWGRGDAHRLGHPSQDHVRYPKLLDAFQGESNQWYKLSALEHSFFV